MVHPPHCQDSCAETPFWVEHEMAPPVQRDHDSEVQDHDSGDRAA